MTTIATLFPSTLHLLVYVFLPTILAFFAGWRWRGRLDAAEAVEAKQDRAEAARLYREGMHEREQAHVIYQAAVGEAEVFARHWIHAGAFDVGREGPPRIPFVGAGGGN